jgi:Glycosyl hydrolase family 26
MARARARTTAVVIVAVAALVVAIVAVTNGGKAASPAIATTSPSVFPVGVRLSGVVEPGAAGSTAFGTWRGKPVQVWVNYLGTKTWDGATQVRSEGLLGGVAASVRRVYSVPLIPTDVGATLVAGAAGDYDRYFRVLAQQLVQGGEADATLRIGWEMTGDWFAWSGVKNPVAWVGAYQKAVTAMRSVAGQHFSFDWTVALGQADPKPLYPGNAYVDLIGADVYDASFSTSYKATDHAKVWNETVTKPYGLNWLARFASQHGKRISFSEWGLADRCDGHGGGDDPDFIQHMYDWMGSHDVAYEAYFNTQDRSICATFAVDSGKFPQAAARYRQLFGGITSASGVVPSGQLVPST